MTKLEGRVVFLTGAGAGIAKATAKACVREGAKVVLAEINPEARAPAEREIRDSGGEALFVETDVTQDASVRRAIDTTVVDPQLPVRGIENLRVADSSICPTIPSSNTNAAAIAIAEKASDMILQAAR